MNHKTLIKEAMKATNTTQAQLGERLGVNQQAISNYLNRDDMMFSSLVRVLDALGYDITITKRAEEPTNI